MLDFLYIHLAVEMTKAPLLQTMMQLRVPLMSSKTTEIEDGKKNQEARTRIVTLDLREMRLGYARAVQIVQNSLPNIVDLGMTVSSSMIYVSI